MTVVSLIKIKSGSLDFCVSQAQGRRRWHTQAGCVLCACVAFAVVDVGKAAGCGEKVDDVLCQGKKEEMSKAGAASWCCGSSVCGSTYSASAEFAATNTATNSGRTKAAARSDNE